MNSKTKKAPAKVLMNVGLRREIRVISNAIASRTQFLRRLTDPKKDIEAECGHPEFISTADYKLKFERGDVADRIIRLYPEECFSEPPLIYETEDEDETDFEKRWKELNETWRLSSILLRADVLSGVGRFGIIVLGINDGKSLDQPVEVVVNEAKRLSALAATPNEEDDGVEPDDLPEGPKYRLLYLRTFDESLVTIKKLETDPTSIRFGHPLVYEVKVWNENTVNEAGEVQAPATSSGFNKTLPDGKVVGTTMDVHWSRVIHLCDNRTTDDIFGQPRLKKVFNRVLDLHKVTGGSGEMFYKGGFPGLSLETLPTDEPVEIDKAATKDEMEEYYNGLKRYIALEGMTAKSLAPQVADPGPHADLQLRLISIALSCPWRIFTGSEVGQLASGQDVKAWNGRVQTRRVEYVSPFIIRPFVDRLIVLGILPKPEGSPDDEAPSRTDGLPKYLIHWNDRNAASEQEKAEVAEKRTNAIAKYVSGGCDQVIPPEHFLELIIGFDAEEVEAILNEAEETMEEGSRFAPDPAEQHQRDIEKIEASAAARAQAAPPGRGTQPAGFARNGKAKKKK